MDATLGHGINFSKLCNNFQRMVLTGTASLGRRKRNGDKKKKKASESELSMKKKQAEMQLQRPAISDERVKRSLENRTKRPDSVAGSKICYLLQDPVTMNSRITPRL